MATQYIWEKEISKIEANLVTFADWSEKSYTDRQLQYVISEEPRNPTDNQMEMLKNLVPEVIDVLKTHNIRKWDLRDVLETIVDTFNNSFNVAVAKSFGTYRDDQHIMNCVEDITMSDIEAKSL